MEWERKFYDIVQETESNLANARRKLIGGGTQACTHVDTSSHSQESTSSPQPTPSTFLSTNDHINSVRRQMGLASPLIPKTDSRVDPSFCSLNSSVEMLQMQAKIDSQKVMIDKLEKLVKNLNKEREQYHRQIGDLQSEVSRISSRMSESTLNEPQLESRMNCMQNEMRLDLKRLENTFNTNRTPNQSSPLLERSFKDLQQNVHAELEELRREFNAMSHRVGRLELDVSCQSLHRVDNSERQKTTGSPVDGLFGHNSSFRGNRSTHSTPANTFQVKELRSTVSNLHDKLDSLESRVAASLQSPFGQSSLLHDNYPQRSPRRPFKPTVTAALDIATDDDDDDSDLDDLDLSEEFDFDSFPSDINGLVGELSKDKKRKRKGSKSKAFLEFDSDSDIDKDLDIDADLEDDFDKILGVDKVDSVWCKTSTGRSPRRKTPRSPPLDVPLVSTSGVADTDPQTEDALDDLDLDGFDLEDTEDVDLDSLEGASADNINLDDF